MPPPVRSASDGVRSAGAGFAGVAAAGAREPAGGVPLATAAAGSAAALGPRELLAMQGAAGNSAASRVLGNRPAPPPDGSGPPVVARTPLAPIVEEESGSRGDSGSAREPADRVSAPAPKRRGPARSARRNPPVAGRRAGPDATRPGKAMQHPPLVLPPYLRDMTSAGLSTASGLTGHEAVGRAVAAIEGAADADVATVGRELAGRPETFYGHGRVFSVRGSGGAYDVTVSVRPNPGRPGPEPSMYENPEAASPVLPDDLARGAAAAQDGTTKVDQQHSSAATVVTDATRSRQAGLTGGGTVLVPTPAPAVWAGAQLAAGLALRSDHDVHSTRTVSEPRVLRSSGGTVRALRHVRYTVRIRPQGPYGTERVASADGTLTMRVPHEHLVPRGTVRPDPGPALTGEQQKDVRQATSLAVVGVETPGAPHGGGGGLFDAVNSVLHPQAAAPGSADRTRLYEATGAATILQDLPRLLTGWVASEDLSAGAAGAESAYRMRADIVSLAPAWQAGQTQLRTHQQAQHGAGASMGKGMSGVAGAGPALGLGAPGAGPAVRFKGMPAASFRRMRFASADQTAATRQGAEVRGDKALYLGRVLLTVEGTGPAAPRHTRTPGGRSVRHTLDAWISMRAEEARHLGLPLPAAMEPGELYTKADRERPDGTPETNADGTPRKAERHLPFGAMGSSAALTHLDTRPLIDVLERLFATNPELAGYLPPFGEQATGRVARADAEAQRRNYRELVTVLSETNLRANKDQLLSAGVPVRLRRKAALRSDDVQIRVRGRIGALTYLGDTPDWLVRSSSGVGSSGQTGGVTARKAGVQGGVRATLVPGALSAQVAAEAALESSRSAQGGPVTRTDSLNSGDVSTSTFGTSLSLAVHVTMTSRERTGKRAVTPGRPGRHQPVAEVIASSDDRTGEDNPLRELSEQRQDVRLSAPTATTLDDDAHEKLTRRRGAGRMSRSGRLDATGITDLTTRPAGGGLRDWDFVETVGDAEQIRDLAFRLLSQAARRGSTDKPGDTAFETEGLAPRLAVEDRFSPQAVTAALRQGVTSGWVVAGLRHPRRLTALDGAVGTRFALTNPHVRHKATGAGMENMSLGGHQGSGQRARTTSRTYSADARGMESGQDWSLWETAAYRRTKARTDARSMTLSGTVERNAVNPRSRPLYLVQCDLAVSMVAEVAVNGSGPYTAARKQTIPGSVGLWLTGAQLAAAGLRDPEEREREQRDALAQMGPTGLFGSAAPAADQGTGKGKNTGRAEERGAGHGDGQGQSQSQGQNQGQGRNRGQGQEGEREQGTETATTTTTAAPAPTPLPEHAGDMPVGFGLIDELPDFVPLLKRLRSAVEDRGLAADLLPAHRLDDRFDNVQRLLRVLDRDGATGLLAGAMDGGVPVELLRNSSRPGRRAKPYWAVFHVRRTGPGAIVGPSGGDREMEYATVAAAQRADTHQESRSDGVGGALTGSESSGEAATNRNGGVFGPAAGRSAATSRTVAGRGQTGLRAIVGDAASVRVRVPVRAELELRSADGRLATVGLGGALVHRALSKDMEALAGISPVPGERRPGMEPVVSPPPSGADPAALRAWHAAGARLPLEAQANGFRGAPQVREVIGRAMAAADVNTGFRKPGSAAHYAQGEAVSTEWLLAALPLLVSGGAELPPVHVSGAKGHDIDCALHARLLDARLLGESDEMTFETVFQSAPDASRPAGAEHRQAARHGRSGGFSGGVGPVRAEQSGMTNAPGGVGGEGGAAGTVGNAAGTVPLRKPKETSALVQFTLEFRAVARTRHRHTRGLRGAEAAVGVRDGVLPTPVVIRMPASEARRFAADG
ncbi:hypothetical protein B1H29_20470 [Streptomyces pactum]|uniref:Uncharacterized protein n=1 Tax=Streptomyces pactum TaxID=68249 RepID=A0A1S6JB49_9ACTN|nr:hypothetical protein B1H29_20470 [Streptomyces pactum]